jgi:hypothetical protein
VGPGILVLDPTGQCTFEVKGTSGLSGAFTSGTSTSGISGVSTSGVSGVSGASTSGAFNSGAEGASTSGCPTADKGIDSKKTNAVVIISFFVMFIAPIYAENKQYIWVL